MALTTIAEPGVPIRDRTSALTMLSVAALVLVLLFATQSFNFLFAEADPEGLVERASVRSNPVYQLFVLVQFALVAGLALIRGLTRPLSARMLAGTGMVALVLGSVLWSVDPRTTLLHGLILTYLIVAAWLFASVLRPAIFLQVLFWMMAFFIAASFLFLAFAPELVTSPRHDAGWLSSDQFKGITTTKNRAGMVFASAFLLALLGGGLGIGRFWRLLVGGFALLGVLLSNAATAAVVLVMATGFALWILYVRLLALELAASAGFILLALVLALPFIDFGSLQIFELIGREGTLTGRDQLWLLARDYFSERPLLGYGYYAFFSGDPFSPAWSFWENFRYFLTDSFHNSAVDMAISLGLAGVLMFCGLCAGAVAIAWNRSIDAPSRCILVILVQIALVDSMTNFSILFHNSLPTFLVLYAFFAAGERYGAGRPEPGFQIPSRAVEAK